MRVGQYVTIYFDPLTQKREEGKACIRQIGETKDGLTEVIVRFIGKPYSDYYERLIISNIPTPLTAKEEELKND